jgi:hypothetical protein
VSVSSGDILRVSARQQFAEGQDHVNVWYWQASFSADQDDQDVVDGITAELDNAYAQLNGSVDAGSSQVDVKVDIVEWTDEQIHTVRTLGVHNWDGTYYIPTGGGDNLPPGVAALVKFKTWDGKVYARKFIGLLTEAVQNSGILDGTTTTALAAMGASILSNFVISAGNELVPVVMSSKYHDAMEIIEVVASSILAYQRRRRPGTGS